jgi:uncharacterized protein
MKIGIISDTHGYLDERIIHHLSGCDEIWHAGDFGNVQVSDELAALKPLRGVYGNIDGGDLRLIHPMHNRFNCEGFDVWITHIGGYPGKYSPHLREKLKTKPPDIFICGHSHILKVIRDKKLGLLHINPGAAGNSGFHHVRTLVLMELENRKIIALNAVELGRRGIG